MVSYRARSAFGWFERDAIGRGPGLSSSRYTPRFLTQSEKLTCIWPASTPTAKSTALRSRNPDASRTPTSAPTCARSTARLRCGCSATAPACRAAHWSRRRRLADNDHQAQRGADRARLGRRVAGGLGIARRSPSDRLALRTDTLVVCGVQIGVRFIRIGPPTCAPRSSTPRASSCADERPRDGDRRDRHAPGRTAAHRDIDHDALLGIGVAAPGAVDAEHGNLLAINLGWRDVDFATPLEAALGVPVTVEHNVRAMALAEVRYGAARGEDSVFYVYVRAGVGAGMIVGGEPFRSGAHGACELGHLRVVNNGPRCTCGATGCLETLIAGPALAPRVAAVIDHDPDGVLASELPPRRRSARRPRHSRHQRRRPLAAHPRGRRRTPHDRPRERRQPPQPRPHRPRRPYPLRQRARQHAPPRPRATASKSVSRAARHGPRGTLRARRRRRSDRRRRLRTRAVLLPAPNPA